MEGGEGEGGGQWSKASASAHRSCSTGALVAFFVLVLVFGVLVGVFLGESRRVQPLARERPVFCQ